MSREANKWDASCPPPVVCPYSDPQHSSPAAGNTFPTEAVLGGTLGGLSVIVLALIIYASFKHCTRSRTRHTSPYKRGQGHRKKNTLALFGDPLFAYDVTGLPKAFHSYAHMQPDVYIARPYVSGRRQLCQRQALAAMLEPRDDCSDREFCPPADSQYEPSIIAGSFVYHPPSSLPPHLTRTLHPHPSCPPVQHDVHADLSYDSFKNDHLYDSATRGMASSTLNNHHQPPDFYL